MGVNVVVIDGTVQHLGLRYDEQSRPELRWTLQQIDHSPDGKAWTSYWPCCASGAAAERLAGALAEGDQIVCQGKLCYRKREGKAGLQTRMEIMVWTADRLTTLAQDGRSAAAEGDSPSAIEMVAPGGTSKKGKPRYPKWDGHVN